MPNADHYKAHSREEAAKCLLQYEAEGASALSDRDKLTMLEAAVAQLVYELKNQIGYVPHEFRSVEHSWHKGPQPPGRPDTLCSVCERPRAHLIHHPVAQTFGGNP